MTVLITGAAGFLGSHAVEHFLENTTDDVIGLVSFRHKGEPARLKRARQFPKRFRVVYHDLRAPITTMVAKEIGPVDYIINYAAESHVDRSIDEPVPFVVNNVDSVLTMLEFARTLDSLKAFVQISTDEVYGPAPVGHAHKEWETVLPSNPYSASKAAQESIAFSYWRTYGLPLVITNAMNLVGERQDNEKYLPMLISRINAGEVVKIHGQKDPRVMLMTDPPQYKWTPGSRFYLHARNLADAVLYLLNKITPARFSDGNDRPDKFHIVGSREVDNLELARTVSFILKKDLRYEWEDFHKQRPGHDLRYALDGSKIAKLGWRAPISFDESLRRTIAWTLDNKEWL